MSLDDHSPRRSPAGAGCLHALSPPSPAGLTYTSMVTMNRVIAAMTQAVTNM